MQKWLRNVWWMGCFLMGFFVLQEPQAQEQAEPAPRDDSMEERSLGRRGVLKIPEPEFIVQGPSARSQGIYFGVGFQQVRLDFVEGASVIGNDAATNGVAFNLGYFTAEQMLEYARHVALLELDETLVLEGQPFNFVEVIQSNWWYLRLARLTVNGYAHYGLGLQVAEARLILQDFQTPAEAPLPAENSKLYRENSLLVGLGGSYFFTRNFFVQYRFTFGNYSPFLTGETTEQALTSTQNHTLFLQYYFSL